ncbi:hypothetical protein [Kitasatospora sp. NPDC093806]|uniref:LppU/SCO3897 family protein n=1 Tax=Kitasatospora sp. NPDC093806 TaxID=3155075 RepID=UPI003438E3DB
MSVPPPQLPYGSPPPDGANPYATGNPYAGPQAPQPAGAPPPPGYGYPAAPPPAAPGYGVPAQAPAGGYAYPPPAGYPAQAGYAPQGGPGGPPTKRPLLVVLLVLVPVLLIGTVVALIAAGVFVSDRKDSDRHPIVLPTPTSVTIPVPTYTAPSYSAPAVPVPTVTMPTPTPKTPSDIDDAKAGDCLRNENGTTATHDANPRITMLPCTDPRAQYKVLKKVYATSDADKACQNVTDAESTYTRESTTSALSFVLCLKKL